MFLRDDPFVKPEGMYLVDLAYDEGIVTQEHAFFNTEFIRGRWSAELTRDHTPLCTGGGIAPYRASDGAKSMPLNTWVTGAERGLCPQPQVGDKLVAVWEWQDSEGLIRRISGELVLDDTHVKRYP